MLEEINQCDEAVFNRILNVSITFSGKVLPKRIVIYKFSFEDKCYTTFNALSVLNSDILRISIKEVKDF